jgi:2-polyprenyl-3-methyl-5-hydroxy-6-metoxy-1,4-benzoquinol methylase
VTTAMGCLCTVCRFETETKVVFTETGIDIVRCLECGHIMSTHRGSQDYDEYFDEPGRLETFWWDQAHRSMYADFCRRILPSKPGSLLDVGAGLGYFIRAISQNSEWDVYGCEISTGAVRYAREVLGIRNMHCGRLEDAGYDRSSFDLITLWDVIEHIPDPDLLLARIAEILKPGGTLFLHTPNAPLQLVKAKMKKTITGERAEVHYLEARDHINLYSAAGITRVLERCGFRNVHFQHLSPIQSFAGRGNNLIFRAAKNGYFAAARTLSRATGGHINIDNLFVIATKS